MKDPANERSGFCGQLPMGRKPALLVVDFQRGFTETDVSPLASDCAAEVANTNRLIAAMRGRGPVIFTIIGYDANFSDAGRWPEKGPSLRTLVRGTAACELDPRLDYRTEGDLVLHKTQASAFFGTPLSAVLASAQCDMLIVAGCTTSGCVRASVVDGMQYGFAPFVAQDCAADRSKAQHDSNLIDMASKYAEVLSADELIQYLNGLPVTTGQAGRP